MFADGSEWEIGGESSPLCDSCGSEPGTVHIIRVEQDEFAHTHLCQSCAEEAAGEGTGSEIFFAVPTSVAGFLGSFVNRHGRRSPGAGRRTMCGVCGSTLADVEEQGLLGCPACYETFAEHIEAALEQGGDERHRGKRPRMLPDRTAERSEFLRLERMLQELVSDERFEEAAGVRDRMTEIRRDAGDGGQA